jgi:hypothetical protein
VTDTREDIVAMFAELDEARQAQLADVAARLLRDQWLSEQRAPKQV